MDRKYLIISWNVNGYSHDIHQQIEKYIHHNSPDVIFLCETKKSSKNLENFLVTFTNYNIIINSHDPYWLHGVVMLVHKKHKCTYFSIRMGIPVRNDSKSLEASDGRVICVCLNNFLYIVGTYVPNSGRKLENLDYRTKVWDPGLFKLLETIRNKSPYVVWIGDINVALSEIDVSDPKNMKNYAGFSKEERENLHSFLSKGNWIDIWRQQNPSGRKYTWIGSKRRQDYGMRLDNIIITKDLVRFPIKAFIIYDEIPISTDHLPIGIIIN
ncbi:MAG: exodeoxyribonuclease III [Nitrososphaerota archaeon]